MIAKPTLFIAALLGVSLLFAGCASSDSRLLGRWRSNRELSVVTFPHRERLSPEKRAFFDGLFGKLTLTYTPRHVDMEMPSRGAAPPFRQRVPYRVLTSDAHTATVKFKDSPSEGDVVKVIHFEGPNRYWIPVGISNGREYFDRLGQ